MSHSPTNILVVNAHSTANAGDHVLLSVTLDELRRVFPDATLTVAMNDPAPIAGQADVAVLPSVTTWFKRSARGEDGGWRMDAFLLAPLRLLQLALWILLFRLRGHAPAPLLPAEHRALLAAYARADLIVSSAGNFLYSGGKLALPLALQFAAIFLGVALGKPLYTMPQTLGPLATTGFAAIWQRAALRTLAASARLLQVRDDASRALIHAVRGPLNRTIVSPDIALLFQATARATSRAAHTPPRLGVTLINWGAQARAFRHQETYERAVAAAICAFVEQSGGEVWLFAQVTGPLAADDDRIPARRVAALLGDIAASVHQIDGSLPAETLQLCYGQMDLFLGTRLHSTLFALVAGTPVMAIAYQPKTRGVFALMGLEEWVLPIEQARADTVSDHLQRLWEQRAGVAATIAQRLPALQRDAAAAADRIAADHLAGDYARLAEQPT